MRMIHFSKPFFFVTITKRLRVIRVWVCVSLQVCLYSSVLKVLVHLHLCCQSVFYFCFCFRSVTNTHRKFSKRSACSLSLLIKRNIVIYLLNLNAIEHRVTLYVCTFGWLTSFSLFNWCFFYIFSVSRSLSLCSLSLSLPWMCVYVIYSHCINEKLRLRWSSSIWVDK